MDTGVVVFFAVIGIIAIAFLIAVIEKEERKIKNKIKKGQKEEWKNKRGVVIKRWSEIAEKNPRLTQEELREIYIRHFPDDKDVDRYLIERDKIISQHTAITIEKKSPGVAAVLSCLIGGLGQIYNGQIGKGLVFLLLYIIFSLITLGFIGFIIFWLLFWIYNIFDAYDSANRINKGEIKD